jgi:hypothetical protein
MLNTNPPIIAPQMVLITGEEVMGHVPVLHLFFILPQINSIGNLCKGISYFL